MRTSVRSSRTQAEPRPRKYVLYEGWDGKPHTQWQRRRRPRVPGCIRCDLSGDLFPPFFRWVVRATSAKEAHRFVHHRVRAVDQNDLGVLWDRKRDYHKPPPLGKDRTQYWALVASCRARTITLWYEREDAEATKALIDETGCGGNCHGKHEIRRMTIDETKQLKPEWWREPDRLGDDERDAYCGKQKSRTRSKRARRRKRG